MCGSVVDPFVLAITLPCRVCCGWCKQASSDFTDLAIDAQKTGAGCCCGGACQGFLTFSAAGSCCCCCLPNNLLFLLRLFPPLSPFLTLQERFVFASIFHAMHCQKVRIPAVPTFFAGSDVTKLRLTFCSLAKYR